MKNESIKIIKTCFEFGAGKHGAGLGPDAVMTAAKHMGLSFLDKIDAVELEPEETGAEDRNRFPLARHIDSIINATESNYKAVYEACRNGFTPLIFSGDHSNAIGCISGVMDAFAGKQTGVIWVDAHLDLHSPFTTPSGNIHGMALNALLGDNNTQEQVNQPDAEILEKWALLKSCNGRFKGAALPAENIVFIGVRDFEEQEIKLAERLGIKIYTAAQVRQNGISAIVTETLNHLQHCDWLYVSYDVDSQDPEISAGTGTPVENGLLTPDSQEIFDRLFPHPKTAAFEITEINPLLDSENRMASSVVNLLKRVM